MIAYARTQSARPRCAIDLLDKQGSRSLAPRSGPRGGNRHRAGARFEAVHTELGERGILCDFRPDVGLRLGPHFFNTDDELGNGPADRRDLWNRRVRAPSRRDREVLAEQLGESVGTPARGLVLVAQIDEGGAVRARIRSPIDQLLVVYGGSRSAGKERRVGSRESTRTTPPPRGAARYPSHDGCRRSNASCRLGSSEPSTAPASPHRGRSGARRGSAPSGRRARGLALNVPACSGR